MLLSLYYAAILARSLQGLQVPREQLEESVRARAMQVVSEEGNFPLVFIEGKAYNRGQSQDLEAGINKPCWDEAVLSP